MLDKIDREIQEINELIRATKDNYTIRVLKARLRGCELAMAILV